MAGHGAARALSATGGWGQRPCPAACLGWVTRGSSSMGVAAGRQGHMGRVAAGMAGTHVAAAQCQELGGNMNAVVADVMQPDSRANEGPWAGGAGLAAPSPVNKQTQDRH